MNITIKNTIVSNDGTEIGKIDGETCTLLQPVGPAIKAGISKAHGNKLKYVVIEGVDGPIGSQGVPGHDEPDERSEPTRAHTIEEGKPERDPVRGDKCPQLIKWKAARKGGK